MKKFKIGTVGCGGISALHLSQLSTVEGAEIYALCDINPEKLKEKGDKYNVPEERRFLNYSDMLALPEIDAIDICTPNYLHVPMAEDAIKAGKHICVEKPLGINYEETVRLKELADQAGVKSMVCFSYRFFPAVRYAKHLVDEGTIGNVVSFYAQYFKSSAYMKGRRLDWRFVGKEARYGVSGDLGVHLLDLASFLSGDVVSLAADLGIVVKERKKLDSEEIAPVETDDICHFLAKFSGGASATFSITRAAYANANHIRVDLYGDKGALRFDLNDPDKLECYTVSNAEEKMETVEVPEEFKKKQMQTFVDLLHDERDKYIPTLEDGVKLQRVLDAILESSEKRAWVDC